MEIYGPVLRGVSLENQAKKMSACLLRLCVEHEFLGADPQVPEKASALYRVVGETVVRV